MDGLKCCVKKVDSQCTDVAPKFLSIGWKMLICHDCSGVRYVCRYSKTGSRRGKGSALEYTDIDE